MINKFINEKQKYISLNPTRYITNQINQLMLKKFCQETIILPAQRIFKTKNKKNEKSSCVDEFLVIGVGAHVMLRKNLDVSKNLTNGALGIVVGISKNKSNYVQSINVLFEKTNKIHKIKRTEVDVEIGFKHFIEKFQFPLILSWAITIHKIQGETLEYCIVDVGK